MALEPLSPTVPSVIFTNADPFEDASTFTSSTMEFVRNQILEIGDDKDSTLDIALNAITALSALSDVIGTLPDYDVSDPLLDPQFSGEFVLPDIDPQFWGRVSDFDVNNTIDTGNLPSISQVVIPGFDPTPYVIDIPDRPSDALIAEPGDAPGAPDLTFPDQVVISLPDQPTLEPIVIPSFDIPTIPDFDESDFPIFQERDISTLIDWQEPTYTEEVMDQVKAQIAAFFAGGSGIDPDIEESIFARARDREDRTVRQAVQQATEEWANKGFTAPPGMLVKRIDNIRDDGLLKKLSANREFAIKVHQDEIENLRWAVQQGISAEQLYMQLFLAKVARLFEVQKLSVEWQIQLYSLTVQVFIAKMEEIKVRAQVYEARVRAALIEVEVFKALVDAERAKAEVNKVLVDAYVAEIGVREALVRMYGEQVKAVAVEADVFKTQVDAYKSGVDAYASRVNAEKLRFDAYSAKIQGEMAKANVLESEAKAYQAQIQGIETGVKAEVAALEGAVSEIEVQIRNYEALVRGHVGKAQAQVAAIEANVAGNNANTQRYIAKTNAEEAASKVELMAWEGKNRMEIEIWKTDIAAFQARLERAVKEIELLSSTQQATGNLASTIVAGAMAAMHVGANISGQSGVSASGSNSYNGSRQESVSCTTQNSSSVNYTAQNFGETGVPCQSFDVGGGSTLEL